ncbi:hypothetical protein ACO0SA_003912 [Hanseniaspora valbyensis]
MSESNGYDDDPYMQYVEENNENNNPNCNTQMNEQVYERNYKEVIPPEILLKMNQPLKNAQIFSQKRKPETNNNNDHNNNTVPMIPTDRPILKLRKR